MYTCIGYGFGLDTIIKGDNIKANTLDSNSIPYHSKLISSPLPFVVSPIIYIFIK